MSPSKPNCMKVKHPRRLLFWGRKIRAHSEIWGVGITGLLGLLAGQTPGKRKLSCAFVMGGRFTHSEQGAPEGTQLLPSHGDWQVRHLLFHNVISKGWPQVLEKHSPGYKTGREL